MNTPTLIPLRQVATLTALSHNTLYKLLKNGQIPGARKISGAWFFDQATIQTFLRGNDPTAPASSSPSSTTEAEHTPSTRSDDDDDDDDNDDDDAIAALQRAIAELDPRAPTDALTDAQLALQRAEADAAAAHQRADAAMRQFENRSQLCLDLQADRDRLADRLRDLEAMFALVDPHQRTARSIAQAADAEFRAAAADQRTRTAEEALAAAQQRLTELEARLTELDTSLALATDRATHAEAWAADAEKRVALAEDRLAAAELEPTLADSDPAHGLIAAVLARAQAAEAALVAEKNYTAKLTSDLLIARATQTANLAVIDRWAQGRRRRRPRQRRGRQPPRPPHLAAGATPRPHPRLAPLVGLPRALRPRPPRRAPRHRPQALEPLRAPARRAPIARDHAGAADQGHVAGLGAAAGI
ncbi:MAG TPA: helix-turn-helix domain-containing protein, partial [Nannocystaceae bacterium]|nr:helix-turn-helix domain-containing protein [Nannocystaceae bacterium]